MKLLRHSRRGGFGRFSELTDEIEDAEAHCQDADETGQELEEVAIERIYHCGKYIKSD